MTRPARPAPAPRRARALSASLVATLALASCVHDGGPPPRRDPPRQPDSVRATNMSVWTGWPADSDGNGFLDSFTVTVMLWDETFPAAPIRVPGSFSIRLVVPGPEQEERVVARWDFDERRTDLSVRGSPAGPSYEFRVSLLDQGTDRHDRLEVEPRIEFRPQQGPPVPARGGAIKLGRPAR